MTTTRQPAGVPTGGQFAASGHARPTLTLTEALPVMHPRFTHDVEVSAELDAALREASGLIREGEHEAAHQVVARQLGADLPHEQYLVGARALHVIDDLHCGPQYLVDSKTEFTKALNEIKRQAPARATITWRYNDRKKADDLPEIEVPHGTVLTIRTDSGLPFLTARSGRVVFEAHSSFGNAIKVLPGAEVHVVTDGDRSPIGRGRKVTVDLLDNEDGERGVATASPGEQGRGSNFRLHHPGMRDMSLEERNAWTLPELEADRWNTPRAWK